MTDFNPVPEYDGLRARLETIQRELAELRRADASRNLQQWSAILTSAMRMLIEAIRVALELEDQT